MTNSEIIVMLKWRRDYYTKARALCWLLSPKRREYTALIKELTFLIQAIEQ